MDEKDIYSCYKAASNKNKKKTIRSLAAETGKSYEEIAALVANYGAKEKPINYFGRRIFVSRPGTVGMPEDQAARQRLLNKRLKLVCFIEECDTVYFLNGWQHDPTCNFHMKYAKDHKKKICYEEYE